MVSLGFLRGVLLAFVQFFLTGVHDLARHLGWNHFVVVELHREEAATTGH